MFALSGAKLKEYKLIRSQNIGSRSFPVEGEMRDLLRKGSIAPETAYVFAERKEDFEALVPSEFLEARSYL